MGGTCGDLWGCGLQHDVDRDGRMAAGVVGEVEQRLSHRGRNVVLACGQRRWGQQRWFAKMDLAVRGRGFEPPIRHVGDLDLESARLRLRRSLASEMGPV